MKDRLLSFLHEYKKKTITLGELEKLAGGQIRYEEFAAGLHELVEMGALKAIKGHGMSMKDASLANSYRICKSKLPARHHQEIGDCQFVFDPHIKLEAYYELSASVWAGDRPFIELIDARLKEQGLPLAPATAPERSYQLVGNEKWIDMGDGKAVLERIGLWEAMRVVYQPDPLMLAVNPEVWEREPAMHLVVENKTPFHALLDTLPATSFLSLIYGAGWKIMADIVMLDKQLGLAGRQSSIYYFGDLDYEGISIWYALQGRCAARPAVEFYRALLARPAARGKENQRCNEEALQCFLGFFAPGEQKQIARVLREGGYYPQEGLNRKELDDIWRNTPWT